MTPEEKANIVLASMWCPNADADAPGGYFTDDKDGHAFYVFWLDVKGQRGLHRHQVCMKCGLAVLYI